MRPNDPNVRREAIKLVQYLCDMAASTKADSCDLGDFEDHWWLSELPPGVEPRTQLGPDGGLFTVDQVPLPPPPDLPPQLNGHIEHSQWTDHDVAELDLSDDLAGRIAEPDDGNDLATAYRVAAAGRDSWLAEVDSVRPRRELYEGLRQVAGKLANQDDEFELVLCAGLISGNDDSGQPVRRHLLVKRLFAKVDDHYSGVTVGPDADAIMVMEDRRFLIPALGERLGRADDIRAEVEQSDLLPTDEGASKWLSDWSGRLLPDAPQFSSAVAAVAPGRDGRLAVSASPAIILRRRDRSSVAGFLDRVVEQLRDPAVIVPQALVQILRDLTPDEQEEWLAAVAGGAKTLGANPLFSREHNLQQRLVLERVRQDNGAVVQGPPGTGKTHTIANLLVATLADGLRVLVVSQKEQPLRVLRGMLPPDMQKLCVSLAGGKDGRTSELESSVRAMAEYLASTTEDQAQQRVTSSHEHWLAAQQRVADIQLDLEGLRESEHVDHQQVSDGYHGRLAGIAARVQENRDRFSWFPPLSEHAPPHCPLTTSELAELRTLLIEHPDGPLRAPEYVPPPDQIHTVSQAEQLFDALNPPLVRDGAKELADLCGRIAGVELDRWRGGLERLNHIVRHLRLRAGSQDAAHWLTAAVDDLLAGRNSSAWYDVLARPSLAEPLSARSRNPLLRDVRYPEHDHAALRDLRDEAWRLRQGVGSQQPVRTKFFRRLTPLGRDTQLVRDRCRYRDHEPLTGEAAAAVHDVLDIVVTLAETEHAWSFVVTIPAATHADDRLRWLIEAENALPVLRELAQITAGLRIKISENGILAVLTTHDHWLILQDAAALARHRIDAAQHKEHHATLTASWAAVVASPGAAPELRELAAALEQCDIVAYRNAAVAVAEAQRTITSHRRLRELRDRMTESHTELVGALLTSLHDAAWENRFSLINEAWTWAVAERFVRAQYRPGLDTQRESDLADAKADLLKATAELATAKGWANCLRTMDPKARRGLKNYEHFAKKQRGRGAHTVRYQKSARSAIADAKPAVPAWVMTISQVAELFPAAPNSFDVVIVDEASQAEPTALFLLWLAPRVIVVGDDKQCTPFTSQRGLDGVINRLRADFPDVPAHVRELLLPNGNLYNILSSAFPAVVRLQEHFRCMPEIISWPSREFYGGDLVPLRQHGANRLEPIKIGYVSNGQTTGSSDSLTNKAEAEYVIDRLASCLDDPAYDGKTFGIIAVQSARQVRMLTGLLHKRIPASEIEQRDIRVGNAQNFQGDERDVMLVSTVAAGRTQVIRNDPRYEQRINVAVSRAKDQLWLITSLGPDLDSEDIRHRMLSHYRESEETEQKTDGLGAISETRRCDPFRSLFVQQVYLKIRSRGYTADPHQAVGGRQLDIVIRGRDRSVAIMCDEYTGLGVERRRKDDESLRELRRAGWPFCRVAHSQFVLDPDKALEFVWQTLTEYSVEPQEA